MPSNSILEGSVVSGGTTSSSGSKVLYLDVEDQSTLYPSGMRWASLKIHEAFVSHGLWEYMSHLSGHLLSDCICTQSIKKSINHLRTGKGNYLIRYNIKTKRLSVRTSFSNSNGAAIIQALHSIRLLVQLQHGNQESHSAGPG